MSFVPTLCQDAVPVLTQIFQVLFIIKWC